MSSYIGGSSIIFLESSKLSDKDRAKANAKRGQTLSKRHAISVRQKREMINRWESQGLNSLF